MTARSQLRFCSLPAPTVARAIAALVIAIGSIAPTIAGDRLFTTVNRNGFPVFEPVEGFHDISGDRTVYMAGGNIYASAGGSVMTIHDNGNATSFPQIGGTRIVYSLSNNLVPTSRIYLADLATVTLTEITTPATLPALDSASNPAISGNTIVYEAVLTGETDSEILTYNTATNVTTRLTDNTVDDSIPAIDGNLLAWSQVSGNLDTEIVKTILGAGLNQEQVISITPNNDFYPRIDGKKIVWFGSDGNDSEIYYHDGITTVNLTNNSVSDLFPDIDGNLVVWMAPFGGTDNEIVYLDLADPTHTVKAITNNYLEDSYPRIDGRNVASVITTNPPGTGNEVAQVHTEIRPNKLSYDGPPYQAYVYAYYQLAYFSSSNDAFYAYAYSYYAFAYSYYCDYEFLVAGTTRSYYDYRIAQYYYSYLAFYHEFQDQYAVPGGYATASLNANYTMYYYGLFDYLTR